MSSVSVCVGRATMTKFRPAAVIVGHQSLAVRIPNVLSSTIKLIRNKLTGRTTTRSRNSKQQIKTKERENGIEFRSNNIITNQMAKAETKMKNVGKWKLSPICSTRQLVLAGRQANVQSVAPRATVNGTANCHPSRFAPRCCLFEKPLSASSDSYQHWQCHKVDMPYIRICLSHPNPLRFEMISR